MTIRSTSINSKAHASQKYLSARMNLLVVIFFTVINIAIFSFGIDFMFLFSATIPYSISILGIMFGAPVKSIIIAAMILGVYFLCWLLSKKHYGWMIAALVLFAIDTVFTAALYFFVEDVSGVVDMVIHAMVLYYLISGVSNGHKLKKLAELPESESTLSAEPCAPNPQSNDSNNLPILRPADMSVKYRTLLDAEYFGHRILYRRIKRVNELVIDGNVYDDVEMLVETPHALNAYLDGHHFCVGLDGMSQSYLKVDGEKVLKKLRFW